MGYITDLKDQSLGVLRGKWGSFVGLTFIYFLLMVLANSFTSLPTKLVGSSFSTLLVITVVIAVLISVIIIPLQYGYSIAHLNASRQDLSAEVGDLFCGYRKFLKVVIIQFLVSFLIVLGFILIIPGIILALAYSMVPYILNDNPELSIKDVLKKSRTMMYGHKRKLLLLFLSFIGWFFLAILTLFVGFLWLSPYYQMTKYKFYEQLLKEQENENSSNEDYQDGYSQYNTVENHVDDVSNNIENV